MGEFVSTVLDFLFHLFLGELEALAIFLVVGVATSIALSLLQLPFEAFKALVRNRAKAARAKETAKRNRQTALTINQINRVEWAARWAIDQESSRYLRQTRNQVSNNQSNNTTRR